MESTGLKEFWSVLTDFKELTALAIKGAIIAPLADLVLHIGPPWPSGISLITSLVVMLSLIYIFHHWFKKGRPALNRQMRLSLVILCASFLVYMYFLASFTFSRPGERDRYAMGFVVRSDRRPLIEAGESVYEILAGDGWDPSQVWEIWSINIIRMILLILWLTLFISLCAYLGIFIIVQRRAKPPRSSLAG